MSKVYVFYNPLANNGRSEEAIGSLLKTIEGEHVLCDMTKGYSDIIGEIGAEDTLILCGGDGTLNRFINETDCESIESDILYYACGSGNDFAHDIGLGRDDAPVSIKNTPKNS